MLEVCSPRELWLWVFSEEPVDLLTPEDLDSGALDSEDLDPRDLLSADLDSEESFSERMPRLEANSPPSRFDSAAKDSEATLPALSLTTGASFGSTLFPFSVKSSVLAP